MNDNSVGWFATRAAERWPRMEFAEFAGRRITFAELAAWVEAVASDLVSRGIHPGDRVLVQLPNCLEVIVLQLATWRIGAVAVPVVPIYRERELTQILRDCRPAAVAAADRVGTRSLAAELDASLASAELRPTARYLVDGSLDGWSPLPDADAPGAATTELPPPADPGACCLILYTSGTTSAPKGAMLSSTALIAATRAWERLSIGIDDVALGVAPLAHIAGMVPSCLVPMTVGCRVTILPRWDPEAAVNAVDRERATFSTGANVFLKDLVGFYEAHPSQDLRKLTYFVSGGAATPPRLVERAAELGMGAMRAYGMTETAGVIAMAEYDAPLERKANYDGHLLDSLRCASSTGTATSCRRGPTARCAFADPR